MHPSFHKSSQLSRAYFERPQPLMNTVTCQEGEAVGSRASSGWADRCVSAHPEPLPRLAELSLPSRQLRTEGAGPRAANGQQRPPTVASNGRPQRALAARERRRPRPAPQPPLSASPRVSRWCPLRGPGHGPRCPGCGFPSRNGRAEPWPRGSPHASPAGTERRRSGAPLRAPRRRAAAGGGNRRVRKGSGSLRGLPSLSHPHCCTRGSGVRLSIAPVSERISKLLKEDL